MELNAYKDAVVVWGNDISSAICDAGENKETIPELGILGCERRNELVDGYPMLKVPPWHQELQPVLFALAGLPLYYLQIARYSTATSCTHMNLQQFLRHYIADEQYISESTRPLQSQLKRSLTNELWEVQYKGIQRKSGCLVRTWMREPMVHFPRQGWRWISTPVQYIAVCIHSELSWIKSRIPAFPKKSVSYLVLIWGRNICDWEIILPFSLLPALSSKIYIRRKAQQRYFTLRTKLLRWLTQGDLTVPKALQRIHEHGVPPYRNPAQWEKWHPTPLVFATVRWQKGILVWRHNICTSKSTQFSVSVHTSLPKLPEQILRI